MGGVLSKWGRAPASIHLRGASEQVGMNFSIAFRENGGGSGHPTQLHNGRGIARSSESQRRSRIVLAWMCWIPLRFYVC